MNSHFFFPFGIHDENTIWFCDTEGAWGFDKNDHKIYDYSNALSNGEWEPLGVDHSNLYFYHYDQLLVVNKNWFSNQRVQIPANEELQQSLRFAHLADSLNLKNCNNLGDFIKNFRTCVDHFELDKYPTLSQYAIDQADAFSRRQAISETPEFKSALSQAFTELMPTIPILILPTLADRIFQYRLQRADIDGAKELQDWLKRSSDSTYSSFKAIINTDECLDQLDELQNKWVGLKNESIPNEEKLWQKSIILESISSCNNLLSRWENGRTLIDKYPIAATYVALINQFPNSTQANKASCKLMDLIQAGLTLMPQDLDAVAKAGFSPCGIDLQILNLNHAFDHFYDEMPPKKDLLSVKKKGEQLLKKPISLEQKEQIQTLINNVQSNLTPIDPPRN